MTRMLWMGVGLAAGAALVLVVGWRSLPPSPAAERVEPRQEGPAARPPVVLEPQPAPRALVFNDLYTSEAAMERAYIQRLEEEARIVEAERAEALLSQIPGSFAGLFDSSAAEDAAERTPAAPEDGATGSAASKPFEEDGEQVAPFTPTGAMVQLAQREVRTVVEGMLRDAFVQRDLVRYLSALDEDVRYTHDAGTPLDPTDDRVYRGLQYERAAISRLFQQYDRATVRLSRPRNFSLLGPNTAQVTYDYDIGLSNASDTGRVAGTSIFLLMRGGSQASGPDWRIVEWYDTPPRQR
jgi:hypothetical protein